jgi:glutathione S-transferase
MLEECNLPYNIKLVNLGQKEQFNESFLKLSPNGRMPAIVDPDGPDGKPISIFESGAILQYLGNKTGKFYPQEQLARTEVEQWLFWQMGGLGPMAGQAAHFRNYKADKIDYAVKRYTDEVVRLYGVMDGRLADRDFLAGNFSIADMACWPWIRGYKAYGIDLTDFTHLRAWFKRVGGRPAVERAANIGKDDFRERQKRSQGSI